MTEQKFDISGMTCAACSAGIQKTVGKMDGVRVAEVSLMGESMRAEFDENAVSSEDIVRAVEALGYGARIAADTPAGERVTEEIPHIVDEAKKLRTRFLLSLIFLIPLMYFTMAHMLVGAPLPLLRNRRSIRARATRTHHADSLYQLRLFYKRRQGGDQARSQYGYARFARFGRFLYLQRRRYVRHRRAHE